MLSIEFKFTYELTLIQHMIWFQATYKALCLFNDKNTNYAHAKVGLNWYIIFIKKILLKLRQWFENLAK
jgi:hypothetical protein